MTKKYRTDESFSLLLRDIPALAFLKPVEIADAFDDVKALLPSDAEPIIQWFENNYVHGRIKRTLRNGTVQRHNPLNPSEMWSIFDNMEFAFPRTQNKVEAWHRRWETLIARPHVGIFTMIKKFKKKKMKSKWRLKNRCVENQLQKSIKKTKKENLDFKMSLLIVVIDQLSIFFEVLLTVFCCKYL